MMHKLKFLIICVLIAVGVAGCTENARLQQSLANANITLVGQDNGMGGHCDGFTLSGDTVILTYNYWPNTAGEEYLSDPATPALNRPASLRGMKAKLREYSGVARAMIKNKAGFCYRRQFADGHIDVYFPASKVRETVDAD